MIISAGEAFSCHQDCRVRVDYVGRERHPVVCIDQFLDGVEHLVDDAIAQDSFSDNTGFYPGIRAQAPQAYYQTLRHHLPPILAEVFAEGGETIVSAKSDYSLVTTPPDELHPLQRIPHFDSTRPNEFAMIHYLCEPEHGGTSFYRQRSTGFESVDDERKPAFIQALEENAEQGQIPAPAYIDGDTELFERIASYDAAFNRLLLYRSNCLHSGNIPDDFIPDPDPRTGRLSINSFVLTE